MFIQKKSQVIIFVFALIILLLFIVFGSTYLFYTDGKQKISQESQEREMLNSLIKLRSEILELIVLNNSNITYIDNYSSPDYQIFYVNNSLMAQKRLKNYIIKINISSLGVRACNNYNFSPSLSNTFIFNGNCIIVTS